ERLTESAATVIRALYSWACSLYRSVRENREGAMEQSLLDIRGLRTQFFTDDGLARAVDGVSYSLERGETVGVVGESGCGKSVTALSILRLIPDPPGKIVDGEILLEGTNLLTLSPAESRRIGGNDHSMIVREAMN